jgi:hypothetical protein
MLKRKIPVIAKSWMKLSLRFIAFATNPNDFLGFCAALPAELEEAMRATAGAGLLAGEGRAKMNWNLFRREIRVFFLMVIITGPSSQVATKTQPIKCTAQ